MADTDDLYILQKEIHSLWSSLHMKATQHVYVDPDDSTPTKLVGDKQGTEISYANMDMVRYIPQVQLFQTYLFLSVGTSLVQSDICNCVGIQSEQFYVNKHCKSLNAVLYKVVADHCLIAQLSSLPPYSTETSWL